jgi:hypothetical protein
MAKTKYGKFVVTQQEDHLYHRPGDFPGVMLVALNGNNVKEATMHFGSAWWSGPVPVKETYKPHYHDSNEIIGIFSGDINDPFNLGGEVDFWYEHEKHTLTKSTLLWVPKGLQHAPLLYRNVTRPLFTFSIYEEPVPSMHQVDDPMFSEFKNHPEAQK